MTKYLFGDLVKEVKNKVDRDNNPYDYFIAGDHMDTDELHLLRRGVFAGNDVGPAFIRIFKPGQVLYGSRRTYLRKVAVADFEGVTANTTFVLESKDEKILLQRLLPFIMQADRFVQHSIKRSKGSTNPYVLFSDLADYEVELPDIDKQCELADLLWAMDDVRMSYQNLISATDALVKSQFIEMFGDLNRNNKGWELSPLSKILLIERGGSPRPIEKYITDSEDGVNWIKIGDADEGSIYITHTKEKIIREGTSKSRYVEPGDFLLSNSMSFGRPYILTIDGYIHDGWLVLRDRLRRYEKLFLYALLSSDYANMSFRTMAAGSVVKNLNKELVGNLMVPVPPMELQMQYAAFIEQSDKSKFELEQALSELNATYKRIIAENLG